MLGGVYAHKGSNSDNLDNFAGQVRSDAYITGTLPSNAPSGLSSYGACFTLGMFNVGSDNLGHATIQFWVDSSSSLLRVRHHWNGAWRAWKEL